MRVDGKITQVLVSVSDVSSRVELARELQSSQQQAQAQVDTLLGGLFAWLAVWTRSVFLETTAFSISGLLLAVPPAVLALAFFFNQAPLAIALALALFPRLFGTLRSLLATAAQSPVLLAARARGLSPFRVATRYVPGMAAPQLFAIAGIALVLAFGSDIPIEAICGIPGIGALALQAAVARDMPLLCALALIITFFVTLVYTVGDLLTGERTA